jgi:hypothetical protein
MELANGETACMLGQRHASRDTHVLGLDWPELLVQVELMKIAHEPSPRLPDALLRKVSPACLLVDLF